MIKINDQTDNINPLMLINIASQAIANARPVEIDWVNRTIRVMSLPQPSMNKNGKRIILSDGRPAYHQDIIIGDSSGSED